jgi:ADP-ribose pyrophosphatase
VYYLAQGLVLQGENPDEGEHLEVFTLSLTDALRWVKEGRITDNKTVSGLFWTEKVLNGGW